MAQIVKFVALLALILFVVGQVAEARPSPFADGSISGTILQPYGGNLGGGFAPAYSNYAAYSPYAGYGFFG